MQFSYASADALLTGRCSNRKRLPYAGTYLKRNGNLIEIEYFGDVIVQFHRNGSIKLFKGSHANIGTRFRINKCLIRNLWCWVDRGNWVIGNGRNPHSFRDGITIHRDGQVTGFDPVTPAEKLKAHHKAMRQRNRLSSVDSCGEYCVGDMLYLHLSQSGHVNGRWALTHSKTGPFKITRIMAKTGTDFRRQFMKLRLADPKTGAIAWNGISSSQWNVRFEKDVFLSAAVQANDPVKNPIASTPPEC